MAGLFATNSMAGAMAKIELPAGIELHAPAGTTLQHQSGTDSQVGKITGPQFECRYDVGLYSDPLTRIADAELSDITVAGRAARLMQKGSDKDAVHVRDVARSVLGKVNLTLHCTSATDPARKHVRAMFRTLQIKP